MHLEPMYLALARMGTIIITRKTDSLNAKVDHLRYLCRFDTLNLQATKATSLLSKFGYDVSGLVNQVHYTRMCLNPKLSP